MEFILKYAIKVWEVFAAVPRNILAFDICFVQLQAVENEKVRWELENPTSTEYRRE